MTNNIAAMEQKLKRLVRIREASVGIDLKRTNFKIAELHNRIDSAVKGGAA